MLTTSWNETRHLWLAYSKGLWFGFAWHAGDGKESLLKGHKIQCKSEDLALRIPAHVRRLPEVWLARSRGHQTWGRKRPCCTQSLSRAGLHMVQLLTGQEVHRSKRPKAPNHSRPLLAAAKLSLPALFSSSHPWDCKTSDHLDFSTEMIPEILLFLGTFSRLNKLDLFSWPHQSEYKLVYTGIRELRSPSPMSIKLLIATHYKTVKYI